MAFKTRKIETAGFSTPQEMFQDNKLKTIMGLMDYQSQTIDNYISTINGNQIRNKNVAFELPTGSGKTLVGLLIAEFHRRKHQRKCLFLCPTNQLVSQVCSLAKEKYGITAIAFTGRQAEYSPQEKSMYLLGKAVGVTSYSSFFALHSFFDTVDILIFDDVHSSENYIIDNWSINIDRQEHSTLFFQLAELFKDVLDESSYSRLTSDYLFSSDVADWCDMLPRSRVIPFSTQLRAIIDANMEESNLRYAWKRIRDSIDACNIYISWNSILIRPYIAPTMTHSAFKNASQRIFMSATLGKSGELERVVGCDNIHRLPIVSGWDTKGLGRKLFIFPDLSLPATEHMAIITKLHSVAGRSVLLVPSLNDYASMRDYLAKNIPGISIFSANELSGSKKDFLASNNAMVIMANRFDGVDFPNDESRMLIVYNLPKVTHLQERFLVSKMAASILYAERIKTRIVQAAGRCTRNASDYSVVCVLGDSILNEMTSPTGLASYHPEMRAEIQFGIENSTDFSNVEDIMENVQIFFNRNDEWESAEAEIVERRDEFVLCGDNTEQEKLYVKLCNAAQLEVKVQYALWKKDYQTALENILTIISLLDAPSLSGYKCYWQCSGSSIAHELCDPAKAHLLISDANKNNVGGIRWIPGLVDYYSTAPITQSTCTLSSDHFFDTVGRMEYELNKFHKHDRFEQRIKDILDMLATGRGDKFERAHLDLGILLGYDAHNSMEPAAPDPYWIINEELCIVAEDKVYDTSEKAIPVKDIKQAKLHEEWIRKNVPILKKDAKIITVIFSNSSTVEHSGKDFCEGLFYCNIKQLHSWANQSLGCLRTAKSHFSEIGNSEWRLSTHTLFATSHTTPKDFIDMITSIPLSTLETK